MQETQHVDDHEAPHGTAAHPEASGLLEDSERVELFHGATHVAQLVAVKREDFSDEETAFALYSARTLLWSHPAALFFLQGASIQQILQPFIVVRCSPRPIYSPRPGLDDVGLVQVARGPQLSGPAQLAFFMRKMAR